MGFSTVPCNEFVEVLASKAPVPGGGGASALVGAVGTALGNMVGSLTVGKKKYADVEEEMYELKAKCDRLQAELLALVERDAEVFEPLSKAYGMPRATEEEKAEKARVMEIVLKDACSVPMEIMEKCCEALELIKEFAAKGIRPRAVLGFRNAEEAYYLDEFARYCDVTVATDDGSLGIKGNAVSAARDIPHDRFYACGPAVMLRAARVLGEGQISLEARMGCGFGACMGCSIKTTSGHARVCKEGPVFDAAEVIW